MLKRLGNSHIEEFIYVEMAYGETFANKNAQKLGKQK